MDSINVTLNGNNITCALSSIEKFHQTRWDLKA